MSTNHLKLLNPERLSESTILELLKSKCIEVPNVKILKKSDLVEMFKRVVLPMPQRRHNLSRHLGKKLNDLRLSKNIAIATEEEQALYESVISNQNNTNNKSDYKTSNRSSENTTQLSKKVCLSNASSEINYSFANNLKHKVKDQKISEQAGVKKRKKILWP